MDGVHMIILISGKRKSGKDFISERLCARLGTDICQIIRISEPIKTEWARKFNLDLQQLLSDGPYKELYRKDMINWSDKVRASDYGYFCREAMHQINRPIVIVSDVRRKTDINYFMEIFQERVKTVRINNDNRAENGWTYQQGVDNVQSECDLDDYECWDLKITNENKNVDQIILAIRKEFQL